MNRNHVWHVMQNEWRKTSKSKMQLILMLLVPFLAVAFISWGMNYVLNMTSHYTARVFCQSADQIENVKLVIADFPEFDCVVGDEADVEEQVESGKIDSGVLISDEKISIIYDSSLITSSSCLKDSSDVAEYLTAALEGQEVLKEMRDFMPEKEIIDLSTDEEILDAFLDKMVGVIGMIIFLMMSSNALALAAGSITGEKERHTFDTLVLCPASLPKILMGKNLVLMSEIFLSGLVGIVTAVVSFALWNGDSFALIRRFAGKNLMWVLALFILMVTSTLVITTVFSVIASAFSETKKAALFASAGMVIISISSMIPTFTKAEIVDFIPVANWSGVIKSICKGAVNMQALLAALCISLILYILGIVVSSKLWERTVE